MATPTRLSQVLVVSRFSTPFSFRSTETQISNCRTSISILNPIPKNLNVCTRLLTLSDARIGHLNFRQGPQGYCIMSPAITTTRTGFPFFLVLIWVWKSASEDQLHLFNPSPCDVLVGTVIEDTVGAGTKKIAKRKLDVIGGNGASYCRSPNNPEQLEKIRRCPSCQPI